MQAERKQISSFAVAGITVRTTNRTDFEAYSGADEVAIHIGVESGNAP